MKKFLTIATFVALAIPVGDIRAQTPTDTLRLVDVRSAALARDARAAEIELLAEQSRLRLQSIDAERLPTLSAEGRAQYQSDVARVPITLPGVKIPTPPHDTYNAQLDAQQRIYDPTLAPRRAAESAHLAESQARVRTALYGLTETTNSAFYSALRSQEAIVQLETDVTDIEAQLQVAVARVNAGTALPSEANILRAELLRRRQLVDQQKAARRAALAVLSDLTGKKLDTTALLVAPDLDVQTQNARTRPEYEQFARSREALERLDDARAAQDKPKVSAFGRVGYGRPGLNPLSDRFDSYWLGGVLVQWTPWTWGSTNRDREVNALQRQIVNAEERAFTDALDRATQQDLANIDRLKTALADDDQIVALREKILVETRTRYGEAVITSAEYVDRQTDLLAARLNRAIHRVELSETHAHLLTTLGIEVH
ncbi:MAG TPA: TolC family protein [Gemmatimonadaceae bacterium]|nr:TolC family protein [Gemmatimonadaceae bacterium]